MKDFSWWFFAEAKGQQEPHFSHTHSSPQGSTLSPLLFLCLLSDIKNKMGEEDEKFYQFADDINLVVIGDTEESVESKIKRLTIKTVNYLYKKSTSIKLYQISVHGN